MDIPLREFQIEDDFECTLTNDDSYYGTSFYYVHNNIIKPRDETFINKLRTESIPNLKQKISKECCVIL